MLRTTKIFFIRYGFRPSRMPMVKVMVNNIIGWNHGLTHGFLFPLLQILDLSPGNVQLAGYMYICTRAMLAYLNSCL